MAQPFICNGDLILAVSPDADSSRFYTIEINDNLGPTLSFAELSDNPGPYLNAIGYRRSDNFIYGIAPNTRDLYRLDASGNTTFLHHFDDFDEFKTYNAGAITPDSKYLVVLGGKSDSPPFRSIELILIDLESSDYTTTISNLTTTSGNYVYSLDIAFDPINGDLYGYDGNEGRLITIELFSALVDDQTFPADGTIDIMAALFFDAFGELYGYAKHFGQPGIKAFYHIDKTTGGLDFLLEGPLASASDGCSCPYRVELLKSVEPGITTSCNEVKYTFEITNTSATLQSSVQFEDVFPPGFKVTAVSGNIYGGQIEALNTQTLTINNMTITPGVDSFFVWVSIGNIPPGIYNNQASLNNLTQSIGSTEWSDDPGTLIMNDSTALEIFELEIEMQDQFLKRCPGDTLLLDATVPGGIFSYSWNTGSLEPILEITEAGIYEATATNDCETLLISFTVDALSPDINLDLGPDRVISLGDQIFLNPNISPAGNFSFSWSETMGQSINCFDCPNQSLTPTANTTYTLIVTDENGCTYMDSVNVIIDKSYDIYAPNAFSPNNDGINDLFVLYGKAGAIIENLQIFNRWGGVVFEVTDSPVNDTTYGWDGKTNGEVVQSGVYVWKAEVRFMDGVVRLLSGSVTVVY
jgi:gliding motility-associated-like protein